MSLRERKKAANRDQIVAACESLFRERGFDGTTITDITDRAGISRQTFFNYFSGKDAVLAELGLAWLREQAAVPRIDTRSRRDASILAGTRRAILTQVAAIEADPEFMRLVFTRSGLLFPGTGAPAARGQDHPAGAILDGVALVMRAARDAGEIRDDVDPMQAAEMYVSLMLMTIRFWLTDFRQDGTDLSTRAGKALDVLESGLAPPRKPAP